MFVVEETDMTRYPAETNGFMSDREPEQPILDLQYKRMGWTAGAKKTERGKRVGKNSSGRGRKVEESL